MAQQRAIAHLEAIRQDVRDEVKRRIEQRDKYSVQLTVSLGAIVAVAFAATGFEKVLIAAPLISIYFTVLILYSYSVHDVLALYLREKLEPELARRCGTPPDLEWERYYRGQAILGIRRTFFLIALWAVSVLTMAYLFLREVWMADKPDTVWTDWSVLIVATVIYALVNGWITWAFWWRRTDARLAVTSQSEA